MSTPDNFGPAHATGNQPLSDLLLAQALEACIRAERSRRGSSAQIIAHAPAMARAELRRLVQLANELEASAAGSGPSPRFRAAARARLLSAIDPAAPGTSNLTALDRTVRVRKRRPGRWLVRASAGLLAATLATGATLTASASALPGDPLYGLKQAREELSLRLALDDQDRVLAHLRQADARLDETARLLEQGRTTDALETAQQYDHSVERATTTFVVTIDSGDAAVARTEHLETKLGEQQDRLEALLQSAPEPARGDLREALATTERGRELMADPRPVERALRLRPARQAPAAAAPVPTSHAEDEPTPVPTERPTAAPAVPAPPTATPLTVLARHEDEGEADIARGSGHGRDGDDGAESRSGVTNNQSVASGGSGSNRGQGSGVSSRGSSPARVQTGTAAQSSLRGEGEEDRAERPAEVIAVQPLQQQASDDAQRGGDSGRDDRGRGQTERPSVVARPADIEPAPAAPSEARSASRGEGGDSGNDGSSGTSSGGGASGGASRSASAQPALSLERGDDRAARFNTPPASATSNSGSSGQSRISTPTPTPTARRASTEQRSGGSGSGSSSSGGSGHNGHQGGGDDGD
jgi:Domain of unknown function (DUF5667)